MFKNKFADFNIHGADGRDGEISLTCPECSADRKAGNKKAKCLSVNASKGTWVCHNCGWTGGLTPQKFGQTPVVPTVPKKEYSKPPAELPEQLAAQQLPPPILSFLTNDRGISPEVLARNKISARVVWQPKREKEVMSIAFPYYRGTELVNVKYRDLSKNFTQEKGAEQILFGLNDIQPVTIIVEGEMDKMAVETAGFENCVSVPNGAPPPNTANYSSKFDFLESSAEQLATVQQFILAVDNDAPGKRLEDELSRRLGLEKCLRVEWPADCKDANDVLLKHGQEALAECIINAQPYPIEGLHTIKSRKSAIKDLKKNGLPGGLSTGLDTLDQYYTVRQGDLCIVTGIPGMGKSEFLDQLLINLARLHGWRFAMCSPENQPIDLHVVKLVEKYAGKNFKAIPEAELDRILDWLDEHFTFILPEEEVTLDSILEKATALVLRKGIQGLVIDPWNEVEHQRGDKLSETEYVSLCLGKIKRWNRKHNVASWIVAHPTKMGKDINGKVEIPTLYSISGSANWRNKADVGITIHRNPTNPNDRTVQVHIQKVRWKIVGKVGLAELIYDYKSGCYFDAGNAPQDDPIYSMLGGGNEPIDFN